MEGESTPTVAIVGATGYTGKLIVAAAREHELNAVLIGRNAEKLKALGEQFDYPYRAVSLADARELQDSIQASRLVINAAGPFSATARPVAGACLAAGSHYIDVTGEIPAFQELHALDEQAIARGIMLMPGVGFAVVASDCLAAYTVKQLPDATTLRIGISRSDIFSRGSARTMLELFDNGVAVRRHGRIEKIRVASLEHSFDFGSGVRSALAVSWPDVFTAYHTTRIPNIETYFEVGPVERTAALYGRYSGWVLQLPFTRQIMNYQTGFLPEGPSQQMRDRHTRVVAVEAVNATGRCVRTRVSTPEAYTFTALSTIEIAKRIIAGEVKTGFQTPAGVFGHQLLHTLSGVQIIDT